MAPLSTLLPAIVAIAVAGHAATGWIYRKSRTADIYRVFIRDMATNHLPHIYHALELLCHKEGITIKEVPPIQFISEDKFEGLK
jgi:hypothetical protein